MRARTAADIAETAPAVASLHVEPFSCFLLMRLQNALNEREHWLVRSGRARVQRRDARLQVQAEWIRARGFGKPAVPLSIKITRVYPKRGRAMDSDGLAASCKHARDGIADWLGIDDGDQGLTWIYEQRAGNLWGVEISITEGRA